jgi:hypothetical protein
MNRHIYRYRHKYVHAGKWIRRHRLPWPASNGGINPTAAGSKTEKETSFLIFRKWIMSSRCPSAATLQSFCNTFSNTFSVVAFRYKTKIWILTKNSHRFWQWQMYMLLLFLRRIFSLSQRSQSYSFQRILQICTYVRCTYSLIPILTNTA